MTHAFSNCGQIFAGGILYYGVDIEGKIHFISSRREKLELKDLENRGIRFPTFIQKYQEHSYPCLKNKPWSSNSIENFLKRNESQKIVDPQELFLRVKHTIQKCPHPGDENELLLLTLSPFQSGLYTVFKTIPYYSMTGDSYFKQSLLELMEKISFNGIHLNSPNSSLISRMISLYGSTLIITMDYDRPGNHFNSVLSTLEEGCRSSGSFYTLNECGLPISLPIYSHKILDLGIRGSCLKNLIIEIQVEKQPDSPFYLHMTETEQELQKIRDDLHICCLENVNDVFNAYQKIETVPGISNQFMEFLSGTFAILKHFAPLSFDGIKTWAKDMVLQFKHNRKFDHKDTHIRYLVAEFIQRFAPDTDGYYVAQDISGYINEAGDLPQELRPEDVTRRLKNFHPHRKRDKMVINDEKDKRRRTKIKFDYNKFLKQVDT